MKHEGGKAGSFGDGSEIVIGACIEVHRHLGPGLLESVHEQCLCHELSVIGVVHEAQVITYLRLSGLPVALLVNFHTPVIKQALRRFTNNRNLPVFPPSCEPENC